MIVVHDSFNSPSPTVGIVTNLIFANAVHSTSLYNEVKFALVKVIVVSSVPDLLILLIVGASFTAVTVRTNVSTSVKTPSLTVSVTVLVPF